MLLGSLQAQHLGAFRGFVACSYDMYAKLKSAGLKATPPSKKIQAQLLEPELFSERTRPPACKKVAVLPLVISKVGKEAEWKVSRYKEQNIGETNVGVFKDKFKCDSVISYLSYTGC